MNKVEAMLQRAKTALDQEDYERLRAIDPDGFGYANRTVPLETIQLR